VREFLENNNLNSVSSEDEKTPNEKLNSNIKNAGDILILDDDAIRFEDGKVQSVINWYKDKPKLIEFFEAKNAGVIVFGAKGYDTNKGTPEAKRLIAREEIRLEKSLKCANMLVKTFDNAGQKISNKQVGDGNQKNEVNEGAIKTNEVCDTLICLMHYQPYKKNYESTKFVEIIKQSTCKKVIYGHLHGNFNKKYLHHKIDDIEFLLTSCDVLENEIIKIR
jgi:predicted phosphohydrolase